MTKFIAALTIATLSFGAIEASAKGDGGAEARAKLKTALAESRKANGGDSGDGFLSSLFGGGDENRAEAGAKDSKVKTSN
ncbi:MAG: hypothetical protein AAF415_14150 [Pseudomonadota bacterium]